MVTTAIAEALRVYITPLAVDSTEHEPWHGTGSFLSIRYKYAYDYTDAIPDSLKAVTSVQQSGGNITLNTDKPVKAQIVDLSTGELKTSMIDVTGSYVFDISNFEDGCRYTIAVFQSFEGNVSDLNIKNHNFCK